MKVLAVNKNYLAGLEKKMDQSINASDLYIDVVNYNVCNISAFRKMLHEVTDMEVQENMQEVFHKEISNNNFTRLILNGYIQVLDVKEERYYDIFISMFEYYMNNHYEF